AHPAAYLILAGPSGVFVCGALTLALAKERPSNVAKNFATDWWAPLGGILILVCSAVSLLAFPLDDIWHRMFGQDVTLWGPTHLLLIGGASFSIIGAWILHVEGEGTRTSSGKARRRARARDFILAGPFLVGLSTFQAAFD